MNNLSKKSVLLLGAMLCVFFSCKNGHSTSTAKNKIIFKESKAKVLTLNNKHLGKIETIPLSFSDSTIIPVSSRLFVSDFGYTIFSNMTDKIFIYDHKGNFTNFVGKKGKGSQEYTRINDLIIYGDYIEILDNKSIVSYDNHGKFIGRKKHSFPAFSFGFENGYYWFYLGNNLSKNRLVKTDKKFDKKGEYLPVVSTKILPLVENNFVQGYNNLTFRESFNSNLYRMEEGELIHSYFIDLEGLQISEKELSKPPFELVKTLENKTYAVVRSYLENKQYLFLMVLKYIPNENPQIYYWIQNKKNKKEKILKIKDFSELSYLTYPQFLSEDNEIYFLGYCLSDKNEISNENSNPSIVKLKIENLLNN